MRTHPGAYLTCYLIEKRQRWLYNENTSGAYLTCYLIGKRQRWLYNEDTSGAY